MYVNTSFLKHAVKACTLVAALVIGTGVAKADSMTFSGTTNGTFASTGTAAYQQLSFSNGSFNGQTSATGDVAFGQAANPNGSFGNFTLGTATNNYNGQTFNLNILFANPGGINGGQNSSFTATTQGTVSSTTGGGVRITFAPSIQSYTFANGVSSGSFTLQLDSLSLFAGQTNAVSGFIQSTSVAATPEPNSLMLLGTGFVSAAGMLMRRRKMMATA